jgi:hypothetical protein
MEVCKFVEFGCSEITNSSVNLNSVKLISSNKWHKAIVYDTIDEQIIGEIINKNDNTVYHFYEKYNSNTGEVCLMINDNPITQPTKLCIYRYIIKIIPNKIKKSNIDYIQKSNQYITHHISFV